MSKSDKIIAYIMQQLNLIGENFGWQMGRIGANYENGYMKCNQDSKAHFRKDKIKQGIEAIINEHIGEVNGMVVTNADRIRNMTDEELATFLNVTVYESGENMFSCDYYANKKYCVGSSCNNCMGYIAWLKEKVE